MRKNIAFMAICSATPLANCTPQPHPPVAALDAAVEEDDGGRIVGGELAEPGSAKWQIQIHSTAKYNKIEQLEDARLARGDPDKLYLSERSGHQLTHRCGGSYIGNGWILTAAHCVVLKPVKGQTDGGVLVNRLVRIGTQDLSPAGGGATYSIDVLIIHAGYSKTKPKDDIAMIRIRENPKTAALVAQGRLAAIPLQKPGDPDLFDEETLRVTGWGWTGARTDKSAARLDRQGKTQINPSELMQVSVNYLPGTRCSSIENYAKFWNARIICAGSLEAGKDACTGDSGGPLTRKQGSERVLVGIVSQGVGCAFKRIPGAYTRVSAYQAWISAAKAVTQKGLTILPEPN